MSELTQKRTTTANSTYPKVAVQRLNQALCIDQNFCLVDSEVLRNRHLRVAAFQDQIQIFKLKIYSFPHKAFLC
jgi:hypothetical protein